MAVDSGGNLYIADAFNWRIRKVSSNGEIVSVAGNGTQGFSGDGGQATSAQITPGGVAVDGGGNLYISENSPANGNNRIRKVSPQGIITTVAGTGVAGYSGDGGPAVKAQINPSGVAVDASGNLFISDARDSVIRKVSSLDGTITTVAGTGTSGESGDGGLATAAQLSGPSSIALDGAGNLYIAESSARIRKVSPDGIINTFTTATSQLVAIAVDSGGNVFAISVDVSSDFHVLKFSPTGSATVIGGNGFGYSGDGGSAITAQICYPNGIVADNAGNVFVSDTVGGIRVLRPTNQSVLIGAVVDAASENVAPISPGKIVVIYGSGLGPSNLTSYQINNGLIASQLAETTVSVNGIPAPLIYTSATQVAAIVPYAVTGPSAQVSLTYQGLASAQLSVPVATSAPSIFTLNQTGAGQAAAINVVDGTVNTAANPVRIGAYISLYATGEGQTTPAGVDGKVASGPVFPQPNLNVTATVGGIPAVVQYAGGAPDEVAGVMQVNIQIPAGVQVGGYVPVVLQVGNAATTPGAVWIAVAN
jgi:uncharacterized protein (TIGR03437 family)